MFLIWMAIDAISTVCFWMAADAISVSYSRCLSYLVYIADLGASCSPKSSLSSYSFVTFCLFRLFHLSIYSPQSLLSSCALLCAAPPLVPLKISPITLYEQLCSLQQELPTWQ